MPKVAVIATASVFLLVGCGSSSPPAPTTTRASTPVAAAPAFLPSVCTNQVERPSSFLIACADGGSGIEHIAWRFWGGPVAQGSGFAFANDCEPNCVAGGIHHATAEIYVSRVRRCGRNLQYTYGVIVAAKTSIAERTTGAYDIACAGGKSHGGVSRTEPEYEAPKASLLAPGAPSDQEVREALREAREREPTRP